MQGCLRSDHDNDGSNGSVGSDYPSERLVPQLSADLHILKVTRLTGSIGSICFIISAGFTGTNRTNGSLVHCLN
jgi:hypothetical protein